MGRFIFLIWVLSFSPLLFAEGGLSDTEQCRFDAERYCQGSEDMLGCVSTNMGQCLQNVQSSSPSSSDVPVTNYENGLQGAAITEEQFQFDEMEWQRVKEISFECPPPDNFSDPYLMQEYEACRQAQQSMNNPQNPVAETEKWEESNNNCSPDQRDEITGACPEPTKQQPVAQQPEAEKDLKQEPTPEQTPGEQEYSVGNTSCAGTSNPQACDMAVDYANQNCSSRSGESKRSCLDNVQSTCGGDEACMDAVYASQGIDRGEMLQTEQDLNQINQDMQYADDLIQSCNTGKSEAQKCCGNPNSCYTGGENLNGLLQTVAMMKGASGGSIKESCNMMKDLSNAGALANTVALGICQNNRDECDTQCVDAQARLEGYRTEVQRICSKPSVSLISGGSVQCRRNLAKIDQNKSRATRNIAQCEALSEQQIQLGGQIGALAVASKLSGACEDAVSTQSNGPNDYSADGGYADVGNMFSGDCSNPSFSSHPTCVACKKDPSLQQCALVMFSGGEEETTLAGEGPGSATSQSTDFSSYSKNLVASNDEDLQIGDPRYSPTGEAGISSTTSGRGGGPGFGSSGSGLSALGLSSKGSRGRGGYNTNILKGAKGGGGYVSRMGFKNHGGGGSGFKSMGNGRYKDQYGNIIDRGIASDMYHLKAFEKALKDPNRLAFLKQQYKAKSISELKRKMLSEASGRGKKVGMQGTLGKDVGHSVQPMPEDTTPTPLTKIKTFAKKHKFTILGVVGIITSILFYFLWVKRD